MARASFFSLKYQFVDRPLSVLPGILSVFVARLPDTWRAAVGRSLVSIVTRWKLAALPTADELVADKTAEVVSRIQAAMDAIGPDGKRGGWKAGKAVLDEARKPGEALNVLPEGLMVTVFMGLPGIKTPHTALLATQLLHNLKQQYRETGHPDYLFSQAVAAATEKLQDVDNNTGNWISNGVLKKMFEERKSDRAHLGSRAREAAVLTFFQQYDEYKKFLKVADDGTVTLPAGTNYEEFAESMLANAYGPYPDFS